MAPYKGNLSETKLIKDMKLSNKEYAALTAQAANYRVILRYLKAGGIDTFLKEQNRAPVDLQQTPDDTTGGESAMFFLKSIADECNRMDQKIQALSEALIDTNIALAKEKRKTGGKPKKTLFEKLTGWMFVQEAL